MREVGSYLLSLRIMAAGPVHADVHMVRGTQTQIRHGTHGNNLLLLGLDIHGHTSPSTAQVPVPVNTHTW